MPISLTSQLSLLQINNLGTPDTICLNPALVRPDTGLTYLESYKKYALGLEEFSAQNPHMSYLSEYLEPILKDLHTAAAQGDIEAINSHIASGTDIKEEAGENTLIHDAVWGDHYNYQLKFDTVKFLIDNGVDIFTNRYVDLYWIIYKLPSEYVLSLIDFMDETYGSGNKEDKSYLLKFKQEIVLAVIDIGSKSSVILSQTTEPVIKKLSEAGMNFNFLFNENFVHSLNKVYTSLTKAVSNGLVNVVEFLLDGGDTDVNLHPNCSKSALEILIELKDFTYNKVTSNLMKLLINHGAKFHPEKIDNTGGVLKTFSKWFKEHYSKETLEEVVDYTDLNCEQESSEGALLGENPNT